MSASAKIVEAYPKAAPIVDDIVALGAALGVDPYFIANVIHVESGFNPQAYNTKSGASGLIQFTTTTAQGLGTTTSKLRGMTPKAQFQYVIKYFMQYKGRMKTQADVYIAIFQPGRLGQPLSTPISSKAQAKNPTIRTLRDYVDKANARVKLPITGFTPQPSSASIPPYPQSVTYVEPAGNNSKGRRRNRKRKIIILTVAAVCVALLSTVYIQLKLIPRPKNRE